VDLGSAHERAAGRPGTIRLDPSRSKNGEGRLLVLEGPLGELIQARHRARALGCLYVFHVNGQKIGTDFRKPWARACRRAGVAARLFHDLRRSAVRELVNHRVDPKPAMTITRHKTRAIFDRYHIVAEQEQREAVRQTWRPLGDAAGS
jgi:integrase